jgi:hypothetical protein
LAAETVETVKEFFPNPTTRLKPGVNEKTFASGSVGWPKLVLVNASARMAGFFRLHYELAL